MRLTDQGGGIKKGTNKGVIVIAKKIYAVKNGRTPGIFLTWDACKAQVDGFPKAVFKSFPTIEEATAYLGLGGGVTKTKPPVKPKTTKTKPFVTIPEPDNAVIDENTIVIYTDGSCLKNPGGPGGHAAIIKIGEKMQEVVGSESSTTNNRMEMKAAIEALKVFPQPTSVVLHTDSQYLKNGFTNGWVKNWKCNGWMTRSKEPVKNQELWIELDRLISLHKVTWKWVKGHNGNPLNERCDELAVGAAMTRAKEIDWKRTLPNQ